MSQPFEIIAGPVKVYLGPVGETMPYVDDVPAGNWVLLGTAGDKNYGEDGVTVQKEQSIELVRTLGALGPVKALRTAEDMKIMLVLHDMTLEHLTKVLNDQAVVTVAAASGTPGYKHIPLLRGFDISEHAILIRGDMSPEGEDFAMQYEIPRGFFSGSPEAVFRKNEPVGLAAEITVLEDPDAAAGSEFGRLVVQDADAS